MTVNPNPDLMNENTQTPAQRMARFTSVKTLLDVWEFCEAVSVDIAWHPDSSFHEYENIQTGKRLFCDVQAAVLDAVMNQAAEVCERAGTDVYTIGLATTQRAMMEKPEPCLWEKEHGKGFDVHPLISALFDDMSWHNNCYPIFYFGGVKDSGADVSAEVNPFLGVDHPTASEREVQEGKRYIVYDPRRDGELILETDDLLEAVLCFLQLQKENAKPTA